MRFSNLYVKLWLLIERFWLRKLGHCWTPLLGRGVPNHGTTSWRSLLSYYWSCFKQFYQPENGIYKNLQVRLSSLGNTDLCAVSFPRVLGGLALSFGHFPGQGLFWIHLSKSLISDWDALLGCPVYGLHILNLGLNNSESFVSPRWVAWWRLVTNSPVTCFWVGDSSLWCLLQGGGRLFALGACLFASATRLAEPRDNHIEIVLIKSLL